MRVHVYIYRAYSGMVGVFKNDIGEKRIGLITFRMSPFRFLYLPDKNFIAVYSYLC